MGINCLECDSCSCQGELNVFTVSGRGHLSIFDGDSFEIHLCQSCVDRLGVKKDWFDNDTCFVSEGEEEDGYWSSRYQHEEEISDLIEELTPTAQQRVEVCDNIYDLNQFDHIYQG